MSVCNPALVSLRAAAPGDREFLWWLHRETMGDYVRQTWGWDDGWQRRRFDENFDPMQLQIVEYEERAIGCISVRYPGSEIFLAVIEIAPSFQRHGIGGFVIGNVLEDADRLQLPVKLSVLKVNPVRTLYERLGFQHAGETATHYSMKREPL